MLETGTVNRAPSYIFGKQRMLGRRLSPNNMYGFTLLELLVVLTIVVTLTSFVLIRVSTNASQSPVKQLESFANRVTQYCNRAVLQGRDLGIRVTSEGYDYWVPDPTLDTTTDFAAIGTVSVAENQWVILNRDSIYQARLWASELRVNLQLEGRRAETEDVEQPQIICYASSQITPYGLELDNVEQRAVLVSDSYRNQNIAER